ncbi:UNVERIFIED_CONTAM: CPBP family intramembrane glutamic endopeptidase, partial [Kocuria sp. CPCC 205274]
EELFSISIFETFKQFTNYGSFISSIITAIVFGLVHFPTYYGGNVLRTIVQILLIQGFARLFFNWVYAKTKSIWMSWAVHLTFDLIFLFIPLLFMK